MRFRTLLFDEFTDGVLYVTKTRTYELIYVNVTNVLLSNRPHFTIKRLFRSSLTMDDLNISVTMSVFENTNVKDQVNNTERCGL